jgi:electron transfer flavoprotein beta subunit
MALGLSLTPNDLRVIHCGNSGELSLQDYIAYGASKIEVMPAEVCHVPISALADALNGVDIILTGSRAELGAGSGLLPYALAEALERPVVANVLDVTVGQGSKPEVRVRQFLPKGQRRQIACPLPLVIAVHPFASVSLKYAYARRMSGQIEVGASMQPEDSTTLSNWAVETAPRRPVCLKAPDKKPGHARLLSAIVSEGKSGVVAFEGTTVDKAQVVLNYLREHRLVDF